MNYQLHELAHVTVLGWGMNDVPPGMTSQQAFLWGEGFADEMALAIITATGGTLTGGFLHLREQYRDFHDTPVLSVPGTGSGGTGGGGDSGGGGISGDGYF